MCLVLRTPYGGPAGKIYSQTPINPYPFGGLLGYWLEELRLKKRFLEVWVKRGLTVEAEIIDAVNLATRSNIFFATWIRMPGPTFLFFSTSSLGLGALLRGLWLQA